MWVASSAAAVAVEGTRQPGERGERKKKSRKKGKQKKNKKQTKRKKRKNKMRTQERKQYDENGKYINKCMKQNCNREETEGEELTASGRGRLSLQKVRWL